jgi:hypothetical protein
VPRCGVELVPRSRCVVEKVRVLGLVELEGLADSIQHLVRHATGVAALEPRVVLDADACDERDLLAAQP